MTFKMQSPVALILCGGGSRGALEVGFYRALHELGLPVDFIIGSSIGALNGAFIAGGMSPGDLAALWRGFRREDGIRWHLRWLLDPRRRPGLFTLDPLRDVLRRTLPATRFEHLAVPFSIVTTELQSGKAVYWADNGDIIEPLVASLSLPGLFPPVQIEDHQYVDGAVANNVPLDQARALGARHTLMIPCVCCQKAPALFSGVLGILERSLSIAFDCKYNIDRERVSDSVKVHVVQPNLQIED